jgi:hypothetical protein
MKSMHAGADASVVRRSMSARGYAGLPVVHYLASFVIQSRWNLWRFMFFAALIKLLAATKWGAALVLRFPRLFTCCAFTRQGPSQAQLQGTGFVMRHLGYALNDLNDQATQAVHSIPAVRLPWHDRAPHSRVSS